MTAMTSTPPPATAALAPVVRAPARASDRVYAELVEGIRDLRLPPGAEISEHDLTAALQVSRTPVREALAQLAANGLVTVIPQVGTRVARIRMGEVREAQFVREHLELAVVEQLAQAAQPVLTAAWDTLRVQADAVGSEDTARFFATDEAFHEALFNAAGHGGSWALLRPMKVQLDRVRRLSIPDASALRGIHDEHVAVAEAVAAGDAALARSITTRHVRRVLDYAPTLLLERPDWVVD